MVQTPTQFLRTVRPGQDLVEAFATQLAATLPNLIIATGGLHCLVAAIHKQLKQQFREEVLGGATDLAKAVNAHRLIEGKSPLDFSIKPLVNDVDDPVVECQDASVLNRLLAPLIEQYLAHSVLVGNLGVIEGRHRIILPAVTQRIGVAPWFEKTVTLSAGYGYVDVPDTRVVKRLKYFPEPDEQFDDENGTFQVGTQYLLKRLDKLLPEHHYRVDWTSLVEATGDRLVKFHHTHILADETILTVAVCINPTDTLVNLSQKDIDDLRELGFVVRSNKGEDWITSRQVRVTFKYQSTSVMSKKYEAHWEEGQLPLWIKVLVARHFHLPYQRLRAFTRAIKPKLKLRHSDVQWGLNVEHSITPRPGDCWYNRLSGTPVIMVVNVSTAEITTIPLVSIQGNDGFEPADETHLSIVPRDAWSARLRTATGLFTCDVEPAV